MKLNITKLPYCTKFEKNMLYLNCEEDLVIPPGGIELLRTGIKVDIPEGYKFDIELTEDMNDSNLLFIGKSISPKKMGEELGLIVFNSGKKQVRLDTGTQIAIFNLIKFTNYDIEDLND